MFSKMFLYIFSGYLCLQEGIDMQIRFATVADTDALLKIYSQYIDTTITFEYVLPGPQEFAERIRSIGAFYPYLVAEEDGRIVGMPTPAAPLNGLPIPGAPTCPSIWTGTTAATVWAAPCTSCSLKSASCRA